MALTYKSQLEQQFPAWFVRLVKDLMVVHFTRTDPSNFNNAVKHE